MASQSEMTPKERDDKLQEELKTGPLRLIDECVKEITPVIMKEYLSYLKVWMITLPKASKLENLK